MTGKQTGEFVRSKVKFIDIDELFEPYPVPLGQGFNCFDVAHHKVKMYIVCIHEFILGKRYTSTL